MSKFKILQRVVKCAGLILFLDSNLKEPSSDKKIWLYAFHVCAHVYEVSDRNESAIYLKSPSDKRQTWHWPATGHLLQKFQIHILLTIKLWFVWMVFKDWHCTGGAQCTAHWCVLPENNIMCISCIRILYQNTKYYTRNIDTGGAHCAELSMCGAIYVCHGVWCVWCRDVSVKRFGIVVICGTGRLIVICVVPWWVWCVVPWCICNTDSVLW